MITMLEEIVAALRSIGRSSESTTRVVGLMLLGVALNVAALHAVDCLRAEAHPHQRISPIADVARTDIRVVRVVVVRALKKFGDGEHVRFIAG
jgi:hypothetical protein